MAIFQGGELDKKVEKLERPIEALQDQRARREGNLEFTTKSPFSRQIENEPVPSRFKMPQIEPYNGTTDPLDHLESYRALMALQGSSKAVLCRAFPTTLRGTAWLWFSGLKPSTMVCCTDRYWSVPDVSYPYRWIPVSICQCRYAWRTVYHTVPTLGTTMLVRHRYGVRYRYGESCQHCVVLRAAG